MIMRTHCLAALFLMLAAGFTTPCRASNLYVSNSINTIEKFTPGGVGSVFANTGLNGPEGLAFDIADNLYAANNGNNTIEKFTPGGVGSVFASTGLNQPTYLAFDTPEPSTWAMFAIGGVALLLKKRLKILNAC